MSRLRPLLARLLLGAFLVAAGIAGFRFYSFRIAGDPSDVRYRASHRQLRRFVERVGQTTEPGATIGFQVSPEFEDERYVFRRFQYLLPGRRVLSPLTRNPRQEPDYLALWRVTSPPGRDWRALWRDNDGTLWARIR